VDSDWSYTVLAGIRLSDGEEASAYFRHGGLQPRVRNDYIAVYGTTGSLYIEEAYGQGPVHLKRGNEWEQQPLPPDIAAAVPKLDGNAERNWASLAREFVKDLNGEPHESYLTFRDGWIFQEAIDAVRRRSGFHRLPNPS
jgi:predicted dehydrogenase